MGFNSQSDFNRFMDGYMDSLEKKKTRQGGSLFRKKPAPQAKRFDKALELEERELQQVAEPKEEKQKKRSLLQKLMLFAGDTSRQEKEARKALRRGTDEDLSEDGFDDGSRLDAQQKIQRPSQIKPPRPIGPTSNGVPISSLRQPGIQQARPETSKIEQNFPYSPNAEKDVRYLLGLINTMLNRMEPSKRNEFYRSSEYRIFESVRKKY